MINNFRGGYNDDIFVHIFVHIFVIINNFIGTVFLGFYGNAQVIYRNVFRFVFIYSFLNYSLNNCNKSTPILNV